MKRLLPSVFFLLTTPAWSQTLPGFVVQDTVTTQCPWDSTQTILTYSNWEAYQTLNSEWNGPRDSSICIDLAHLVSGAVQSRIMAADVDTSRAVFVRALLDSMNTIPLYSNEFYGISAGFFASNSGMLDNTGACGNGICSGLLVAVQVPDSAGTGRVLRWHQQEHEPFVGFSSIEMCMPTERFANNDMREVIYKLTFANAPAGSFVGLFGLSADPLISWGGAAKLTEASMLSFNQSQFQYYLSTWPPNHLVMYEDTTYPTASAISYLDLLPVPNITTQDTVSLTIDAYTGLVFQPFTQFRGGLVSGSTTQRHFLEINDMGMDLCLSNLFVELVVQDDVRYVHHGGYIDFQGERSCFMVGRGGTFAVQNNATLYYGHQGKGMLALKTGGNLDIRPGGELVMQGTIIMYEYADETESKDIHTTLPEGAKLTFAPGSHIMNHWSIDQDMKLYVYLDGGSVDLSGLPPAVRDLVVVVPLPREPLTEIVLLGNPVTDQLVFSNSTRAAGTLQIRITDALGRTLRFERTPMYIGPNRYEILVHSMRAGTYILEIAAFGERHTARFVKQ